MNYKKGTEEVMALSRKAAGQIPHEAHELNAKTVNKIWIAADEILKKDIDLNNKGADKAANDAADSYSSAFWMMAIILGAAIVAGVAVGFYLVRDVSRGIASIVQPMQALGHGELAAEVPHQRREDRNRHHGGCVAGVQGSADRQEGRRRGRGRRR